MRFGSTGKVLAKCMLKYYRISECDAMQMASPCLPEIASWDMSHLQRAAPLATIQIVIIASPSREVFPHRQAGALCLLLPMAPRRGLSKYTSARTLSQALSSWHSIWTQVPSHF